MRSGASLHVFDGRGNEHHATLLEVKRSEIVLEIGNALPVTTESPRHLTLLQGIARNDHMDLVLQKAVELGVHAIQPLWMQRSQKRLQGERMEKRNRHWKGVIISACEQCSRATLPTLLPASDYASSVKSGADDNLLRLMLQPEASLSLRGLEPPAGDIAILVGPEGGLTAEEQSLASSCGFTGVRMGPRILRTETAALAALAGIQTLWGDFD
mgnify:FL=1